MLRKPSAARLVARTLALAFLAATIAASGHSGAQPAPSLVFGVVEMIPTDQMYVEPSSIERFVVFQGETVVLRLQLTNMTGMPQRVDTSNLSPSDSFRLIPAEGGTPAPALSIANVGHVERVGPRIPVGWGSPVALEPASTVIWRATFEARGEPGIQRWQLELPALGKSARLEVNNSRVAYELRAVRTFADRAELLRRRMLDLYLEEDPAAYQAAATLLAFYPQSFEAHHVMARLDLENGRKRAARRHLTTAIRLLTGKRDSLYLDQVRPALHDTNPLPGLRADLRDIR